MKKIFLALGLVSFSFSAFSLESLTIVNKDSKNIKIVSANISIAPILIKANNSIEYDTVKSNTFALHHQIADSGVFQAIDGISFNGEGFDLTKGGGSNAWYILKVENGEHNFCTSNIYLNGENAPTFSGTCSLTYVKSGENNEKVQFPIKDIGAAHVTLTYHGSEVNICSDN